jgi:SAM-dependent methyltransferase
VHEILDRLELPFSDLGAGVIQHYHRMFATRYANTLADLSGLPRNLVTLELAANPYGMTAALVADFFDNLRLASFGQVGERRTIRVKVKGEVFYLEEKFFNVESDHWPYADGEFDLVISCEMLEHLAMDPMHVFSEANRVLKPGGLLFVSTPNSSSFQNVVKVLKFKQASLAPHYRGPPNFEGVYQRHNRELTPPSLSALFEAGGFTELAFKSVDNYPFSNYGVDDSSVRLLRNVFGTHLRGDTLNFLGKKMGGVIDRFPEKEELYIASDPR